MKAKQILIIIFSILASQSSQATQFEIVNLAQNAKEVIVDLYFKDDRNNIATIGTALSAHGDKQKIRAGSDTIETEANDFNINTAKLDSIDVYYHFGIYNNSEPLSWEGSIPWTNKINWNWTKAEREERRRYMLWHINNLKKLNIPADSSRIADMMHNVQIRVHPLGKCEIIKNGQIITTQGKIK